MSFQYTLGSFEVIVAFFATGDDIENISRNWHTGGRRKIDLDKLVDQIFNVGDSLTGICEIGTEVG